MTVAEVRSSCEKYGLEITFKEVAKVHSSRIPTTSKPVPSSSSTIDGTDTSPEMETKSPTFRWWGDDVCMVKGQRSVRQPAICKTVVDSVVAGKMSAELPLWKPSLERNVSAYSFMTNWNGASTPHSAPSTATEASVEALSPQSTTKESELDNDVTAKVFWTVVGGIPPT